MSYFLCKLPFPPTFHFLARSSATSASTLTLVVDESLSSVKLGAKLGYSLHSGLYLVSAQAASASLCVPQS